MVSLYSVVPGAVIHAADLNQYLTLLSGGAGPIAVGALPTAAPTTIGGVRQREFNVKDFYPSNATIMADGTSRPLSNYFGSLASAQALYPFATALSQETDRCAIQLCINTALGGTCFGDPLFPAKIVFDGVVDTVAGTVSSATATFTSADASIPNVINIPGAGSFNTQYGALISTFVDANHLTIPTRSPGRAGMTGATVVWGQQVTTRTAIAPVYIPAGGYMIDAPLWVVSALGLTLRGCGYATKLQPKGTIQSVLYIDGVADCSFSDFYVTNGPGTEVVTEAISYQWTGFANFGGTPTLNLIQRTTTRNRFARIGLQGVRFKTAWGIGTATADMQCDQTHYLGCSVYGPSDYLVQYGSGATLGTPTFAGGAVTGCPVTAVGTLYTVAPTVAFTGGGGTGAHGTAVLSGGTVASITMDAGGTGYTSAPTPVLLNPWQENTTYTGAGLFARGFVLGSGTSGNTMIHSLYDTESFFVSQGYNVNEAKGVGLYGGGTQNCATTVWLHSEGYFEMRGFRCEGDLRFLNLNGITATAAFPTFENIDWHGNHANEEAATFGYMKWAEMDWAGVACLKNVHLVDFLTGVLPYIFGNPDTGSNSGNAGLQISLDGVTGPSAASAFCRGNSHVTYRGSYQPLGGAGLYSSQAQLQPHALLVAAATGLTPTAAGILFGRTGTTGTSFDTNLYSSAANTLTTDGALVIGTNLEVLGQLAPPANPITYALQGSGGVDETMATVYEAFKFTPTVTVDHTVNSTGVISVWAKVPATTSNPSLTISLYSDDGGSPSKPLAQIAVGHAQLSGGALTTSLQQVYLSYNTLTANLTSGQPYWVVMRSITTSAFVVDSLASGTNVVATGPDGTTWTVVNGKSIRYSLVTQVNPSMTGLTTYGGGFNSTSVAFYGISSNGTYGEGGIFSSQHFAGINASSKGYFGLQASSTWDRGAFIFSQQGIGANVLQSGTLVAANSNAALRVERTGDGTTGGYSGPLIFGNDAPSAGASSGALIRLQVGGVDKWVVDHTGTLTTGGLTIPAHATTHEPGGTDPEYWARGHKDNTVSADNYDRWLASASQAMVAGSMQFCYFTPQKNLTITQLFVRTGGTPSSGSPTLTRLGIYSVDGSNNLTLVFQSADIHAATDPTQSSSVFFTVASKGWHVPLTLDGAGSALANYTLVRGQRYAFCFLQVAGVAPSFSGLSSANEYTNATLGPRITGNRADTVLASSYTSGQISDTGLNPYIAALP